MSPLTLFSLLLSVAPAARPELGPPPREVRLDRDGDPLPDGAVARLGSRRFRDPGANRLFVDDSGEVVACFDDDGPTVRWWDLTTGRYLRGWAATGGGRTWFSPDGRAAAVASGDRLEVWDAWNDRRVRTFAADISRRVVAAVSPDGRTVAVVTGDWGGERGRVRVWDATTGAGRLAEELEFAAGHLVFADGGRLLIVGALDGKASAWDLETRRVRWRLDDCDGLRVDRQGRWLVTEVGRDGKLVVYDVRTGRPVPDTESLPANVGLTDLADVSPCGRTLLIRWEDGFLWDRRQTAAANDGRQFPNDVDGIRPRAGAFYPDGHRALVAMGSRLEVFDVDRRRRLPRDLAEWGQPAAPRRLSWSADGRRVVTWAPFSRPDAAGWEGLTWDPATGRIAGKATDRDGRWAERRDPAVFGAGGASRALQSPVPRDAAGHWIPPNPSYTMVPGGALLAAGQLADVAPAEPPAPAAPGQPVVIEEHEGTSRARDDRVTAPTIFEGSTGRPLVTLRVRHAKHLALSPDGRALAVGEPDGIHLYDVLTGRELLVRKVPSYPRADPTAPAEFGLSFSPDGNRLAVLEAGGTVLVFDVTVHRERPPLAAGEVDRLWADLASDDPRVGWAAVARLCDHPAPAVRLLTDRLTAVTEPAGLAGVIRDLNAPAFRTREAAGRRLLALGDAARPAVAAALKAGPPAEVRERLERLAPALADDRPPVPADLQWLRALIVLERVGTPEAWLQVRSVADGLPGARVTREAKRAADRDRP